VTVLALAAAAALAAEPGAALRHRTVTAADGVPLAVVECGTPGRPAALLLHGFSLASTSFLPLMTPADCARWHLVAFDQRGHGRSGKPWTPSAYAAERWADDVASVIAATGLSRPVIVGWSFGGYTALDYWRRHGGSKLRAINLVGSHGGLVERLPPTGEAAANAGSLAALQGSDDVVDNLRGAEMFVGLMSARPLPDRVAAAMRASVLMLPPYARAAMRAHRLDNRDLVARLDVPVTVSLGGKDASIPIGPIEALASTAARVRLSVYPAAGHMVFADEPARFRAELGRLLSEEKGAPARPSTNPTRE